MEIIVRPGRGTRGRRKYDDIGSSDRQSARMYLAIEFSCGRKIRNRINHPHRILFFLVRKKNQKK
jgi:hypothetical protein